MIESVYQDIISFENLYDAYRRVRLNKRLYKVQQRYEFQLETNLSRLAYRLRSPATYQPRSYHRFTICEPKKRQISAPYFEDRIVHQAIHRYIEPGIVSAFIPTSYACLKERGTHKAVNDLQAALRKVGEEGVFYLKADVKSYFASVDHAILKRLLRKYINCPNTLVLMDKIIDSYEDSPGKGIPIGNLTSQLFANLYLNELDQVVVRKSQSVLGGRPFYFRYMDDFIVLAKDKQQLIEIRDEISRFLQSKLGLDLHPRKRLIQRVSFGIDFCGYQMFADRVVLRKKTIRRFVQRYKRRQKKIDQLKEDLAQHLSPEFNPELASRIGELEEGLERSVVSHVGFLQYSEVDTRRKDYVYVNKIRLPYLPKDNDRRVSSLSENL